MKRVTHFIFHALRIVLAGVLLYACHDKILHPDVFALSVFRYQLVPDNLVNIVALFVPWFELVLGLALLFVPRFYSSAALLTFMLLTVFTIANVMNIIRGINVACGCFSADGGEIGWPHVGLNLLLIAACAYVLAVTCRKPARATSH